MSEMDRYDAIVIGAGMSGLAAGIRIAQYDQRVVVLEKHSLWGGLNSFYKQAGRRLDVGLHAMTNYAPPGQPGPLNKILRQLRLRYDDLHLAEQNHSRIHFPSFQLRFSNDFEMLREEVHRVFPSQVDGLDRLVGDLPGFNDLETSSALSARDCLADYLSEPALIDAVMVPICYYGSARENDVDWGAFAILFRSLFIEGFCRPDGGVRPVLDMLRKRLQEVGAELRMRTGVDEILVDARSKVCGVRLADGTELHSERVLSSAGWVESMQLAGRPTRPEDTGRLSFVEAISVLDRMPKELGCESTITFFNTVERFHYERPTEEVDARSGVLCCPNNYAGPTGLDEGILRVTALANYDLWSSFTDEEYAERKARTCERLHDVIAGIAFDPRPHTVHFDAFTPRTVKHFTSHAGGAVYGSPNKRFDGRTPIEGLFLCGTDQGMLGIVGAMLSGITMANEHVLRAAGQAVQGVSS